tara:strand:- start:98 stop:343 length:246 start_codon:yes stop_codon:yes gene_type:complete
MNDFNKKAQELVQSKKYYSNIKRSSSKNYRKAKKDPDGKIHDMIDNFNKERRIFLNNNKSLLKTNMKPLTLYFKIIEKGLF